MRNLKLSVFMCMAVVLVLALLAGACAQPASKPAPAATPEVKPIALKFAGMWPETNSAAQALMWWASEIEKRTGGKVKFTFYWNEILLKTYDIPKGIGQGVADCGVIIGSLTPDLFPLRELSQSHYLTPSPESGGKGLWDLFVSGYEPLITENTKLNLKCVGVLPGGQQMWFYKDKKPDFPADNKGLKMRASGRNIDIVKKLEAVPVAMPSGEAYEALQRGTIDCAASMTMDSAYTMKMHEVAKYVMFPEFGGYNIDTTAVFNIDSWNKLPKDVQDLIWKMGVELADKNRDLIMNVEQKQAKEMVAKGLVLYKLSPEAKKQWQALIVPSAWNDYITSLEKKGITNAREAFNKYTEAAKKYEKDIKWVDPF